MTNKALLILFIFAISFIFNSCSKGNNTIETGYKCMGGNCISDTSANAQFTTLASCQVACGGGGGTSTGSSVSITASWSNPAPWNACQIPYLVVIGLGYNFTDVANEAYFSKNGFIYSSATFTKSNLAAGIYYYGAKKTYNTNCGTGQGIPPTVKKSGSFTIVAGQNTTVSGVSLN